MCFCAHLVSSPLTHYYKTHYTATDTCEVTYSGTLRDGTPFDAGTTSFAPNQVIKGWTEAMQLMAEGDKWRLHIPYDLAYGAR
jgi:FKBP-type peptidyl-prolyl cis-trans isomerase FklB